VLEALAEDLRTHGELDLTECFIDGTFIVAKRGGELVRLSGAKARNSWWWQMLMVFLSPATRRLLARMKSPLSTQLAQGFTRQQPEHLIGDRAYDCDPLDAALKAEGIEMIAPHKSNRVKAATQDGRALRRYRRRWKIERLNAWLQNFRRIATRFDYHAENYLGFVHLGCIKILLRCYL
jgi:transposase